MQDTLKKIQHETLHQLSKIASQAELDSLEIAVLGRKGSLAAAMRQIASLPVGERPRAGQLANQVKQDITRAVATARKRFTTATEHVPVIDVTWPGVAYPLGHIHPITQFVHEIVDIFSGMGFSVVEGTEVETAEYNFDLLNIPKNHPVRDLWDTYYIEKNLLLRTHTSPVQLRAMKKLKAPVRIIAPGRVFRHEATDAGHESMFYQCEGLVIDKNISVAHLIGTLDQLLKAVYGKQVKTRVRPEYYPFVEPGLDVDMQCLICNGVGCSVCKQRGWLEMLGSGMVHPQVLKNMGVDPEKYSGFAFGLGIDRLMMLKHGINDIRLSYSGDLRFLEQF